MTADPSLRVRVRVRVRLG
jgi:hypothetical protein